MDLTLKTQTAADESLQGFEPVVVLPQRFHKNLRSLSPSTNPSFGSKDSREQRLNASVAGSEKQNLKTDRRRMKHSLSFAMPFGGI